MDTKAFQELQDRIKKESAARMNGQPLPVEKTPTTIQPAKKVQTQSVVSKVSAVNDSLGKSIVTAPQRVATAGMGAIGNILSAPQKFVQSKITGGKGYEDFYTNNPIGKKIVSTAQNPIINNAVPIAKTFSSPKAAAFTSELALDPLNLVGAGVVSKVGKAAKIPELASKVSSVVSKIPGVQKAKDVVGAFQYGYGLEPKFLRQLERLKTEVSKAGEYASNVAKPLKYGPDGKELPKQTQTIIGDIMRTLSEGSTRGLTQSDVALLKKYEPVVKKVFKEFDRLATAQVKAGVKPEVFSELSGKYGGKRIFSTTVKPTMESKGGLKLDISPYMKRQKLSDETRKTLGEIKEPAYGAAVSAYAEKKNVEIMKFFKSIAKKNAVSKEGFSKLDDAQRASYTLIPKEPKYGVLAGSYVPNQVATYIRPLVEKGATGFDKVLEGATKIWKPIKTVLSPGQLGRNTITSQIQAFLENPMSLAYLPKAIKENVTKGKFYKALKDTGEIAQSSPAHEIGKFMPDELSKFSNSPKALLSKAWELIKKPGAAIQNANESTAKLQSFMARLSDEAGKARITLDEALKRKDMIELARQSAESSGFNYQKVSPLVSKLRKGYVPFITYPLKAAGLTGKTLVKHPERIAALQKGEQAIQNRTEKTKPDEQYMPSYLNQSVRIGKEDKKGATPYLNTKYLYPWGNMTDAVSGEGDFNPFTNVGISPNPFLTEAYSLAFKKDIFGKDITEPGRHAAETFGPSFVRSGFRLKDALTKNPSSSTAPSIKEILLKEVGIPLYKYNPTEGASWKSWDKKTKIDELKKAQRKYIRDYSGKKSPEEIDKKMQWYADQIVKVNQE